MDLRQRGLHLRRRALIHAQLLKQVAQTYDRIAVGRHGDGGVLPPPPIALLIAAHVTGPIKAKRMKAEKHNGQNGPSRFVLGRRRLLSGGGGICHQIASYWICHHD